MNPTLFRQEWRLDPKGQHVRAYVVPLIRLGSTEHHPGDAVFRFDETVQSGLITADGLKTIPAHSAFIVGFLAKRCTLSNDFPRFFLHLYTWLAFSSSESVGTS
ncbi:MAG: hypothetical protein ACO3LT_10675, partial [Ilumatobacteraceae bacterium]